MEKIEVIGASVDFFKSEDGKTTVYQFDTSRCSPPEPMINAMLGLKMLDNNSKLIMINHRAPMGLFPKIEQDFEYEVIDLENGTVKIVFTKKLDAKNVTDFTQNSCGG